MRQLASAIQLLIGIALAVPGVLLALWVVVALYKVEVGFDWALWALEHSPFELTGPSVELANEAIQRNSLISGGMLAAVLCSVGFSFLRGARRSLRPPDESHDGKARIVLKAAHPRVGRPLEGSLRLTKDAEQGDVFQVELSCSRYLRSRDEKNPVETPFFARLETKAAQGSQGWSVPFRFEVPATAPPTMARGLRGLLAPDLFVWELTLRPLKGWIVSPSEFALELAAAPQEELRAIEATESPAQKEVIDAIERLKTPLLPYQRAMVQALSPEGLAMARKASEMSRQFNSKSIRRLFILFVVALAVTAILILALELAGLLGP